MTKLVCAFTGHRPEKLGFPWDESEPRYKRLKQKLFCEILQLTRDGVSVFITGMARGVDQLAAEIVLSLKDVVPDRNLQLWAAVPYDRQSLSWSPKDKARYDATLTDKTDNYALEIDSTAGEIFKNGVGESILIARLWQNGTEVDVLKSTTYSTSAPSSPATGDFYYKVTKSTPTTALMRYSGSDWTDVTTNTTYGHTKTYKWYRRDKDGNPLDNGSVFATGKVIFVDGDDVDSKTVFVCEVE